MLNKSIKFSSGPAASAMTLRERELRMTKENTISEADFDIFNVVDTPEEAIRVIKRRVVL